MTRLQTKAHDPRYQPATSSTFWPWLFHAISSTVFDVSRRFHPPSLTFSVRLIHRPVPVPVSSIHIGMIVMGNHVFCDAAVRVFVVLSFLWAGRLGLSDKFPGKSQTPGYSD